MIDLVQLKSELRETLVTNLPEVFKTLKKLLPQQSPTFDTLLALEARLNDANLKRLRGVLDNDALQTEYNRLREDILDFIDSLEARDFDPSAPVSNLSESGHPKQGSVLYRIPNTMQVQEETRCVVRIALSEDLIIRDIELDQHVEMKPIRVSDVMMVELLDANEEKAFAIRSINSPEQFIDADTYTEWTFFVKPLIEGTYPITVKVSVIEMIMGKERLREIVLEEKVNILAHAPEQAADEVFRSAGVALDMSGTAPRPMPSQIFPMQPAPAPQIRPVDLIQPFVDVKKAAPKKSSFGLMRAATLILAGIMVTVVATFFLIGPNPSLEDNPHFIKTEKDTIDIKGVMVDTLMRKDSIK